MPANGSLGAEILICRHLGWTDDAALDPAATVPETPPILVDHDDIQIYTGSLTEKWPGHTVRDIDCLANRKWVFCKIKVSIRAGPRDFGRRAW